jgi:hypothetical protein
MKDRKPTSAGDPDGCRMASAGRKGSTPARQRGFVERAIAKGHSGHGAESVRPHLRDQLKLKSLMPQPYPTPAEQKPGDSGADEYRR